MIAKRGPTVTKALTVYGIRLNQRREVGRAFYGASRARSVALVPSTLTIMYHGSFFRTFVQCEGIIYGNRVSMIRAMI